jgi:nitrogen fixation/metabolism regulation signal transduction histidine kinase
VLAASICGAVLLFVYTHYYFLPALFCLLVVAQTLLLIRFLENNNRRLQRFFDAINYSDFTLGFSPSQRGRSFDELNQRFNEVVAHFKANRIEKEEHYHYLQTVVEHISVGIIVFRRNGDVDLVNNAFKKILHLAGISHVKDLEKTSVGLGETLLALNSGESCLRKMFLGNELLNLSIYATEFRMRGEEYMLVSIQDIHDELEETEIESWQKLTRVLTHEIMNSITPIASLASSMKGLISREDGSYKTLEEMEPEQIVSLQDALQTIEKRSAGLLRFVDVYRNLTRIPKPGFRHFPVRDLFNRVGSLLQHDLDQYGIRLESRIFPEQLMLTADPDLIEQVLINLVLNSVYALKETRSPYINLTAFTEGGAVYILVSDNGRGITEDLIDKIFVPFFTSRKDGSGVGLSLARQIMHLHKGSIYVRSRPGEETVFTLAF